MVKYYYPIYSIYTLLVVIPVLSIALLVISKLQNFKIISSNFQFFNSPLSQKNHQKSLADHFPKNPLFADSLTDIRSRECASGLSILDSSITKSNCQVANGMDPRGVEPLPSDLTDPMPHRSGPTQNYCLKLIT